MGRILPTMGSPGNGLDLGRVFYRFTTNWMIFRLTEAASVHILPVNLASLTSPRPFSHIQRE